VRWRNFAAWMVLFTGGDLGPAVAELEAAIAATRWPGWAALHTLAVCHARAGRHREALDTIRRAADVRGRASPIDQLVLGRIAASAGLTAAARRAYRAVIADTSERDTVGSSAALARRWMAELPR
jgi:protein-disulfide isomerase-like protein with CxxC motif